MAIAKQQQQNDEKDNGGEFQFYSPEKLTRWQKFRRAIFDPHTNQILGRTPKSWGQLFIFYSIFYMVLAALFAICMQGLFATLDENEPTWKLESSLIGINPGLGFRPISARTEEGSLIWYNVTNQTTIQKWVDLADEFLEPYKAPQTGENFVNCNFDKPPGPKQVCITSVDQLGNCHPSKKYGYNSSSPCVFLKLNRIYGWVPEFYTTPEEDMPEDLKQHIKTRQGEENKQIWVTCNGINDFDKENVKGFNYHPRGFASYYYPYKNLKNYLSPIIGVEVVNVTPNMIISIECRAWAKNIQYRGGALNRAGSVTFEIQVDRNLNYLATAQRIPWGQFSKVAEVINPPDKLSLQTLNVNTTTSVEISFSPSIRGNDRVLFYSSTQRKPLR